MTRISPWRDIDDAAKWAHLLFYRDISSRCLWAQINCPALKATRDAFADLQTRTKARRQTSWQAKQTLRTGQAKSEIKPNKATLRLSRDPDAAPAFGSFTMFPVLFPLPTAKATPHLCCGAITQMRLRGRDAAASRGYKLSPEPIRN